ncbi:hybrid signal transduction histidine kinase A [Patella vulgata]|uniref:hybrid signal transduction histidine kinase A n=1 Tax=Patella vulgata TaxID=6465 RepID=UPI00217FDC61|nr:hybrid signal transduction histidine kinase A [Patella vulgata]
MTASIGMASISSWGTQLSGNQCYTVTDEPSSWKRQVDKQKLNSDSSSMNGVHDDGNLNSNTNMQDFNHYHTMNTKGVNSNGELEIAGGEHLVDKHNIVSVSENPFFKSYGKIRSNHSRNEYRSDRVHSDSAALSPRPMLGKENDSIFTNPQPEEDEEEVEYHPGSGFVTKLLGKFKKFERETSKEDKHPPIKRSASLENILSDRPTSNLKNVKTVKNENVAAVIKQGNLGYRTKSVEHINQTIKPVAIRKAPDAKLGRKDIVIIESEKGEVTSNEQNGTTTTTTMVTTSSGRSSPHGSITVLKDEINEVNELPKPNTVTNTRNIFESSKSVPKKKVPQRPANVPNSKISAVAPTKLNSTNLKNSSSVSSSREKAAIDVNKNNNAQKSKDVPTKIVHEVPATTRSLLPPITTANKHKKSSPIVTVAPYKPRSEENYTTQSSVPLPQKPVATLRQVDKKPAPPKPRQMTYNSRKEVKETKMLEVNHVNAVNTENKEINDINLNKDEVKSFNDINLVTSGVSIIANSNNSETNKYNSDKLFKNSDKELDKNSDEPNKNSGDIDEPIKGIPTIIANRMKKENSESSNTNSSHSSSSADLFSSGTLNNMQNNNINNPTKKRQAPPVPVNSSIVEQERARDQSPEPNQELSPRQNLHNMRSKNTDIGGPAMVFDSSMLAKKKRKPDNTNNNGVPKLDLTSIIDGGAGVYQEGYKPVVIKPCNIIFIGANIITGRSLLKKGKSTRGRIKFNDQAITLHEYPSELYMLEEYLLKHPDEENIILLETFTNDFSESTDDDNLLDTPRQSLNDDVLKSNTALSHSAGLSSYQSKYQEEFDWNSQREPDPIVIRTQPEPENIDTGDIVLPAGEDDTNTWSESTSSDLLF